MSLQRLDFREFQAVVVDESRAGTRIFQPMAPQEEVAPPPPVYTQEDLQNAENIGYRNGFIEGMRKGHATAENEHATIIRNIDAALMGVVNKFSPILQHYHDMSNQLREDMPNLALAIARKIAGSTLDGNAQEMLYPIIASACESMLHEPKLTITIHETMADALTERLNALAERMPAATQILIMRNPEMPIADCKIEWDHGSMERTTEHLWQQIEHAVNDIVQMQKRNNEEQLSFLYQQLEEPSTGESPQEGEPNPN